MRLGVFLVAGCVLLEVGRELSFKRGAPACAAAAGQHRWGAVIAPSPMWLGILFWAAEMLLWIATLQHLPLTVALPLMAASFAAVPLAGHLLLRERLGRRHVAGILLVATGVACVGFSGL